MMSLWPGSYQDREEPFNFQWNAAIEVPPVKQTIRCWDFQLPNIPNVFSVVQVSEGSGVVLQNNIVAGYERVAYRIDGEPCPGKERLLERFLPECFLLEQGGVRINSSAPVGFQNLNEAWVQNEAHGGLYGVYLNKDGLAGCSFIRGFFVWKAFDFAIYFQVGKTDSGSGCRKFSVSL